MKNARRLPPDRRLDDYLTSRPHAWLVFGMAFLPMVFDLADRQIIASMLPYPEAVRLELRGAAPVKATYDPENVFHLNLNVRPPA